MANGQDNWNGARTTLTKQNQYVNMPQTPNGSLILGYLNQSKLNNAGEITATSGGTAQILPVPPLIQMLSLLVRNWKANNLKITNTSAVEDTPILVQAFGPGIPGATPVNLPIGQTISLGVTQAAQGISAPRSMLLRFTASTGNLSIIGIVGGPTTPPGDTNAYVIALNAPDAAPPPDYYAATMSNSYTFPFNWGSSIVYVANLSPIVAATVSVTMTAL